MRGDWPHALLFALGTAVGLVPEMLPVMAFVRKIREKIEPEPDNPRYLLTVWGVGYKVVG